jgi:trimethylamine--corrinoid protein Co-methyltransferase
MTADPATGAAVARRGRRTRSEAGPANSGGDAPSLAVSGGSYAPLSQADLDRLHGAALEILGSVGMANAPASVCELVVRHGGSMAGDGRLQFPADLVRRALDGLTRDIVLHGQVPGRELTLSGKRVHVGSGGAAPFVVDLDTGAYRPSNLRDLYDAARLVDALDNVQFFSRSLVARDMPTGRTLDINTAFASLAGTTKHVCVSAIAPDHVAAIAEMCFAIAGSPEHFRARPFLSLNVNHVVPPLRFSEEACAVLAAAARIGIPIHVNTFGQLGASSPVTIAGSVAQTVAETLAGMIYAWLINPEVKAIFGPRPMVTDLRSGAMAGGAGEQALLTAAAVQMAQYYGLSNSTIAGATDSKVADAQSGYEKCLSVSLAAQTGCNLITQACGMQAGLIGCSFESYVIDNDMLGAILRSTATIEVSDATLSPAAIGEVVRGDGHYLGHADTLRRMKSDFLYPSIADRRTPDEWAAAGAPDIRSVANRRARDILARHFPGHLGPDLSRNLRTRFEIMLPAEAMRPS